MTPQAILATVAVALALPLDAAPDRDAKSCSGAIENIANPVRGLWSVSRYQLKP
ncbi:MAG: hypothetical protein VCA35_04315 [Roseibacillus sp.]